MKTRSPHKAFKIWFFVLGGLLVFFILFGLGIWWLFNFVGGRYLISRETPPEIREARVLTGADLFAKNNFFQREDLNYLKTFREASETSDERERQQKVNSQVGQSFDQFEEIVVGELDGQNGTDVVLAGRTGAYILAAGGEPRSYIPFEFETVKVKIGWFESEQLRNSFDNIQVVDLDGDGKCEFLVDGIMAGAAIFDHNGKLFWKYGARDLDLSKALGSAEEWEKDKTPYVSGAAAGDLDGDGKAEIFLLMNHDGLRIFDHTGKPRSFQPLEDTYGDLKIADLTGGGMRALLEKTGKNIIFRDAAGKVFQQTDLIDFYGDLVFCSNPEGKKPQLIDESEGKFKVIDINGLTVLEMSAPLSRIKLKTAQRIDVPSNPDLSFVEDEESMAYPKAAWVRLKTGSPKYLAVAGRFIGLRRSVFYVYDGKGKLVYHEVLPEESYSVAALPREDGSEAILVGGEKTVWQYNLK